MYEVKHKHNDVVIRQGDMGDNFYVVASGEYHAYVGDDIVQVYGPGDMFGELALLFNCDRQASVVSSRGGLCWTLDQETFGWIVMARNKQVLDKNLSFLKTVELLGGLTYAQLEALAAMLEEEHYGPNEEIVREGDVADTLFLIKSGEVTAFQSVGDDRLGKQLGVMKQSEFFGETSLESGLVTRKATVISNGHVVMLKLDPWTPDFIGNPEHQSLCYLCKIMSFNFVLKVLGSMDIFKDLRGWQKAELVDALEEEELSSGVPIIKQGSQMGGLDCFYIIKSGSVKVGTYDGNNQFKVVQEKLGPSDYFGEMALIKDGPRMATVITTSQTTVMKLSRNNFEKLGVGQVLLPEAERREMELMCATRPTVKLEDLQVGKILGVGTFARVKLVLNRADSNRADGKYHTDDGYYAFDGKPYALKCMRKGQIVALKQVSHQGMGCRVQGAWYWTCMRMHTCTTRWSG